jgi:hypothetical protein
MAWFGFKPKYRISWDAERHGYFVEQYQGILLGYMPIKYEYTLEAAERWLAEYKNRTPSHVVKYVN